MSNTKTTLDINSIQSNIEPYIIDSTRKIANEVDKCKLDIEELGEITRNQGKAIDSLEVIFTDLRSRIERIDESVADSEVQITEHKSRIQVIEKSLIESNMHLELTMKKVFVFNAILGIIAVALSSAAILIQLF